MLVDTRDLFYKEAEDWWVLDSLAADPSRLGPADLANLRVAIQRARFENRIVASIGDEQLGVARRLGQPLPKVDETWLAATCKPIA